jgi:hypothetical protein
MLHLLAIVSFCSKGHADRNDRPLARQRPKIGKAIERFLDV